LRVTFAAFGGLHCGGTIAHFLIECLFSIRRFARRLLRGRNAPHRRNQPRASFAASSGAHCGKVPKENAQGTFESHSPRRAALIAGLPTSWQRALSCGGSFAANRGAHCGRSARSSLAPTCLRSSPLSAAFIAGTARQARLPLSSSLIRRLQRRSLRVVVGLSVA
jgi:hypothetical protein